MKSSNTIIQCLLGLLLCLSCACSSAAQIAKHFVRGSYQEIVSARAGKPFIISTYDPTYFVDMTYAGNEALRLSSEMEKNCKLTLFTPNPDASLQAYALSLDKNDSAGENMKLGQQFAQRLTVQCL